MTPHEHKSLVDKLQLIASRSLSEGECAQLALEALLLLANILPTAPAGGGCASTTVFHGVGASGGVSYGNSGHPQGGGGSAGTPSIPGANAGRSYG